MDDISGWRTLIDEIDEKLLNLVNKRAEYAIEIGKIKARDNIEICDPEREKNLISRIHKLNKGPFSNNAVQHFFEALIQETKKLEVVEK